MMDVFLPNDVHFHRKVPSWHSSMQQMQTSKMKQLQEDHGDHMHTWWGCFNPAPAGAYGVWVHSLAEASSNVHNQTNGDLCWKIVGLLIPTSCTRVMKWWWMKVLDGVGNGMGVVLAEVTCLVKESNFCIFSILRCDISSALELRRLLTQK